MKRNPKKSMKNYYLMHKNNECGIISIDELTGSFKKYIDNGHGFSPFLNNATNQNMAKWWEMRSIPANRETIRKLINSLEVTTSEEYLAKNLALSVTDTYWIKPIDADLDYEDLNFFNLKRYNEGKIPYHNATSYSPNASLGGQMDKFWDLNHKKPILVKESYRSYGQQAINEVFATEIHGRLNVVPFVKYTCEDNNMGGVNCKCESFTSKDVELISAYEIVASQKVSNDTNMYNSFIDICAQNGIDKDEIQTFMDYQTMTDFLISNTDEHLMNFGVLRDANTMKLISPAPIYDSGNSMFYSETGSTPFSRVELLERKITSFYDTEEKMLKNVKNRHLIDMEVLPLPDEVKDFYIENGLREERADFISTNYANKYIMLNEFINGKTISLYNEKKKSSK